MESIPRIAHAVPRAQGFGVEPLGFVHVGWADERPPVGDGGGAVEGEGEERAGGGVLDLCVGRVSLR